MVGLGHWFGKRGNFFILSELIITLFPTTHVVHDRVEEEKEKESPTVVEVVCST